MESLSDIETELRTLSQSSKYCELQPTVSGKPISFYFAEIADRIKAAAPITEKSSAVGNAAAMREALEEARKIIKAMGGYWARITLPKIDAALSAPPRNCDVGTAEEQGERFRNFCKIESSASGGRCTGCRAICYGKDKCDFAWAQMPYEAGRKGEGDGQEV